LAIPLFDLVYKFVGVISFVRLVAFEILLPALSAAQFPHPSGQAVSYTTSTPSKDATSCGRVGGFPTISPL